MAAAPQRSAWQDVPRRCCRHAVRRRSDAPRVDGRFRYRSGERSGASARPRRGLHRRAGSAPISAGSQPQCRRASRGSEFLAKRARDFEMLSGRLDRAEGYRRAVARPHDERRHRAESGREHGLPLQRLRRRFAVAAAILDGKRPPCEKAAALRDIRRLGAGGAAQQFTPRPLEIDVAKRGIRQLAEKGQKLSLQRPAGNTSDRGEPVTFQPCPTLVCIASSARRTLRGNGVDEMYCLAIIPKLQTVNVESRLRLKSSLSG